MEPSVGISGQREIDGRPALGGRSENRTIRATADLLEAPAIVRTRAFPHIEIRFPRLHKANSSGQAIVVRNSKRSAEDDFNKLELILLSELSNDSQSLLVRPFARHSSHVTLNLATRRRHQKLTRESHCGKGL